MYSLYKGGSGVLPRKSLENLECKKSHLPHFKGLFFIFLFFFNQFSFLGGKEMEFFLFNGIKLVKMQSDGTLIHLAINIY